MPSLLFSDGTTSGFNWQVTNLGSAWNSSNYIKVVLCTGTTSEGSTTAPSGIVGTVNAPTSGSGTSTPKTFIGGSAGTTYSRNAYAQAANGKYYFAGSDSITLPSATPSSPTNISFSVNGKTITAYWTKGANAYETRLDFSWESGAYNVTTTGSSYTFTVPNFNTSYSVDFISFNQSGSSSSNWTGFRSFTSGPDPTPSVPTGLFTNVISKSQINLGWNQVSGAEGYNIFRNGVYIGWTANNWYSVTGLGEYTYHSFKVRATKQGYESADSATVGAYTLDETIPTVSILAITPTNSRISVSYSGRDDHSGINEYQMYISPPGSTTLYYKTSYGTSAPQHTFETDGLGNPLSGGKTYTIGVKAVDKSGNFSLTAMYTVTLPNTRPADWGWLVPGKYSGGTYNLTADEWYKLCTRINDFRNYKGLAYYGFTDPMVGDLFYAYMFNQARAATQDLPRSISVPSAQSPGNPVMASLLNQLRDALNSVA